MSLPHCMTRRALALPLAAWTIGLARSSPVHARSNGAPALLLAHDWRAALNPADHLVSEKLDGVRAYWNGQALITRGGLPIHAPAWFTQRLPPAALDGELWLGRRRFDEVSALVRANRPDDALWRQVSFQVFELPNAPGAFEQRAARLREIAHAHRGSPLQAVPQQRATDERALRQRLAEVVQAGGEGLMLHRADAPYLTGRNDALLKLKPLHDAEAVVVGHTAGAGRYDGMLGALEVQSPEGQRFKLGTGLSDEQRRTPPAIGSTVTYTYRDVTPSGKPRFAAFLRASG
jgi:DNA ligase 1